MGLHKNLTGDDLHIPQDHTHLEVDITDLDSYLPLTAGSGQPLTGDLHIEAALKAETDTGIFRNAAEGTFATGNEYIGLGDPNAILVLYGSATRPTYDGGSLALSTDLDDYLLLTAGSGEPLTGDLWVETASIASVVIRADGAGADYGYVRHNGSSLAVAHLGSAASLLDLDPIPEGTSASTIRQFRGVNTSGTRKVIIYEGDGTGTVQHDFDAGTGDVSLCQQAGKLTVGGPVQLPYLGAAPSGLTNGMIWMESDGLHLYYADAEKVVAGS